MCDVIMHKTAHFISMRMNTSAFLKSMLLIIGLIEKIYRSRKWLYGDMGYFDYPPHPLSPTLARHVTNFWCRVGFNVACMAFGTESLEQVSFNSVQLPDFIPWGIRHESVNYGINNHLLLI